MCSEITCLYQHFQIKHAPPDGTLLKYSSHSYKYSSFSYVLYIFIRYDLNWGLFSGEFDSVEKVFVLKCLFLNFLMILKLSAIGLFGFIELLKDLKFLDLIFLKPAKPANYMLYAIVYKIQWQIYKQLPITLQVLKIFQFLYRYFLRKLNKEETETFQIKIESKTKKIIYSYWIFL